MNVNLLDLKPQHAALEPELQEAFLRVLRSGHFILGPEVDRFERALARFHRGEARARASAPAPTRFSWR